MRPDNFIISIILVFIILIGSIMIFDENITSYNINVTNKVFTNMTAESDAILDNTDPMKGDLKPVEISSDSALNNLVGGAYNAGTKIWQFASVSGRLVNEAGEAMGIEENIMNLFMLILMVGLLFALIFMIFRFQGR